MQEASDQQNSPPAKPASIGLPPFWHPGRWVALARGRSIVLTVALLAVLFMLLMVVVVAGGLQPTWWDIRITHEIQELPDVGVGWLLVGVSEPGFAPWTWIVSGVALAIMLWRRWYVEAAFTALASLGGMVGEVIKNLIDRPRPTPDFAHIFNVLNTYSFPSTHVVNYVSFYGFLFYLAYTLLPRASVVRKILLPVFAALILLVGPSRVYMGQHWASDALAGYALGFAYLLLVIEGYRFYLKNKEALPTK